MIGAICLELDDNTSARLYLSGSYKNIDWGNRFPSALGEKYFYFSFKEESGLNPVMSVVQGLDGEYILRLIETKRYLLKIEKDNTSDIILPRFQNEENKFLKCDKDSDSISFQFIHYLGRSRVIFTDPDITLPFEVVPDKMNYEDDYIKLTEALADVCSELLLDYAGSTSNLFSHSDNNTKTLLEQFIFLRKFCYEQNVQSLFEAIKRNPDRILDQEEELKPVGTGRPSGKFYRNPFSYSRGWVNVTGAEAQIKRYIPQKVAVTRKYDRLDTPANRFIKFALQKIDSICSNLINALETDSGGMQLECLEEAKAIHKFLDNIFRDSFFDEVSDLDIMPQNNQILLKREGYSQIFAAFAMLDLALQLDWKGKDEIYEGESKNVALLYEYWLFFELYKIVKSIEGCISINTDENPFLLTEDGVTISLEEGKKSCQSFLISEYATKINLYYNRTFSTTEFKTTRYEGSYSRSFRPDYTLAIFPASFDNGLNNGEEDAIVNGAVSYIHFDAKYRITDLTALIGNYQKPVDEEELFDEKIDSVVNTYKRGDLLKMHTYNDAIRRTIGSYVLYPGSYGNGSTGNEAFRLYDEILPGVGAFSIKPSMGIQGENELKSFIVSVIKSREASNSRLNRLKYYTEMILGEPSIIKGNKSRFIPATCESMKAGDMYVMGYIRADNEKDYYTFLKGKGFLKRDSEFLFYFYAIKGKDIYSHHKDIFRAHFFRFYINQIRVTGSYILEPVLCRIYTNELISKEELVDRLCAMGFSTKTTDHYADFYYVLKVNVVDDHYTYDELKLSDINFQNSNDTFSPYSPKVLVYSGESKYL